MNDLSSANLASHRVLLNAGMTAGPLRHKDDGSCSLSAFLGMTLAIWLVLGMGAAAHFALRGRAAKRVAVSSGGGNGSSAA